MRPLVVAYYFPPLGGGGVNRTLKLVRGMTDAGWKPVVLTVDDAAWTRDPGLSDAVPRGARVLRLPNPDWGRVARWRDGRRRSAPADGGGGRLRRWLVPDLCVGWSALCVPLAVGLARARAIDAVFTTCPPYSAHAIGLAARAAGVAWVADFRDAWLDCPTRSDLPAWRRRVEAGLESAVFRRADRVIFASEGARRRALARAPELRRRSETVLTGFDPADFAEAVGVAPPEGRLEVVHAGGIDLMNRRETLDRLLGALKHWAARDRRVPDAVRVRFLGADADLAQRFERAGISRWVRVEPQVPRAQLPSRLAKSHLCLALASGSKTGADPIPGKVFDAVGAGRPVLALTGEGALARLVRERGLGAAVDPSRPEGIADALAVHLERVLSGAPWDGPAPKRLSLSSEHAVGRMLAVLSEAHGMRAED